MAVPLENSTVNLVALSTFPYKMSKTKNTAAVECSLTQFTSLSAWKSPASCPAGSFELRGATIPRTRGHWRDLAMTNESERWIQELRTRVDRLAALVRECDQRKPSADLLRSIEDARWQIVAAVQQMPAPQQGEQIEKPGKPVYTPEDLAAAWGCTPNHVRQLAKSGRLRAFRVGSLYRFTAAAVADFGQSQSAFNPPWLPASLALRRGPCKKWPLVVSCHPPPALDGAGRSTRPKSGAGLSRKNVMFNSVRQVFAHGRTRESQSNFQNRRGSSMRSTSVH
jgi:excisionase family DNA binding protein